MGNPVARIDGCGGMRFYATMGVLARSLRTPVTFATLILLAMVFAATHGMAGGDPSRVSELQRQWGTVQQLTWVLQFPDRIEVLHPEMSGPFELWDGQWWRIPASALHHADFWHLFLNSLFLASFGAQLERCWGSWRYALFLMGGTCVTLLPEFLVDHYAMGFSGVCCAIFGALWSLRRYRADVAESLTQETVIAVLVILGALALFTELGLTNIANLAHFAGLAYGWLTAEVMTAPGRYPQAVRWSYVAAHLLLIGPYWIVVHPVWIGRYHWYLATVAADGRPTPQVDETQLLRAVEADPRLAPVWVLLADQSLLEQRPLEAWARVLSGLQANPTNDELWDTTQRIWRLLALTEAQPEAEETVRQQFGWRAEEWLRQIRRRGEIIADASPAPVPVPQQEATPADRDWWRRARPGDPKVDPADPTSAMEGRTL